MLGEQFSTVNWHWRWSVGMKLTDLRVKKNILWFQISAMNQLGVMTKTVKEMEINQQLKLKPYRCIIPLLCKYSRAQTISAE